MLGRYGAEFFGGETLTSILLDSILELMVPAGIDRSMMVTTLKRSRLNFKMCNTKKPRNMVIRAKELRARFETWNVPFDEKDFVNDTVIPALSPAYAEVTEQHRRYADYPLPVSKYFSAMAVYKHLVRPVATLDELMIRLQQVHFRTFFTIN